MTPQLIERDDRQVMQVRTTCICHIVRQGDCTILIDPGALELTELLTSVGISRVDAVFLTRIERTYSQALLETPALQHVPVYTSRASAERLRRLKASWQGLEPYHRYVSRPGYEYPLLAPEVIRTLEEGSPLLLGELFVRAFCTSAEDEQLLLSLEFGKRELLFCGALVTQGGFLPGFEQLEGPYNDYCMGQGDLAHRALSRLEELSKEVRKTIECYSSHSVGPVSCFDIALLSRRLRALLGLLRASEGQVRHSGTKRLGSSLYSIATTICLVSASGNVLLYDYGWPEEEGLSVFDELKRLTGREDLTAHTLIVSHYHDDHVSGIPSLKRRFPDLICIGHALHDQIISFPRDHNLPCLGPAGYPENGLIRFDRVIEQQQEFSWFEYRCTLLPFPGQTRFHTALISRIEGRTVLFGGDSVLPPCGGAPFRGESSNIGNRIWYEGRIGYLECAAVLERFAPDMIASSHHGLFSLTSDDIKAYRRWSSRLDHAFERLCPSPYSAALLFDSHRAWIKPFDLTIGSQDREVRVELIVEHTGENPLSYELIPFGPPGVRIEPECSHLCLAQEDLRRSLGVRIVFEEGLPDTRQVIAMLLVSSDWSHSLHPVLFLESLSSRKKRYERVYEGVRAALEEAKELPREHRIAYLTPWFKRPE